jgi:hypothetical protein
MLSESSVENKAVDDESDEERGGVEIGEEAEKRFASAVESDLF